MNLRDLEVICLKETNETMRVNTAQLECNSKFLIRLLLGHEILH